MVTKHHDFNPRVQARLAAYTAVAGAALAAAATPSNARADIIFSGPINLAVPNTGDGIYINFLNGMTGTTGGSVPGFDFNPYSGGGGLLFYWGGAGALNAGVAATTTGPYLVLQPGALIGPASTYSQNANGANNETSAFRAGVNGYLGVSFRNENTAVTNYGYVHFQTTGTTGYPATILDYAYQNNGSAITIVPEPTVGAMIGLGLMALGAAGVRRWRLGRRELTA